MIGGGGGGGGGGEGERFGWDVLPRPSNLEPFLRQNPLTSQPCLRQETILQDPNAAHFAHT